MANTNSKKLREKKEEILRIWEARCLAEVAAACTVSSLSLRDSLPLFLDHLSEALDKKDAASAREAEATRIGRRHGVDRAANRCYSLNEVIFEYHILRETIFKVLEKEGPVVPQQRDVILDSVEQAVNDAAVEFSEIHADIQQKFVSTLTHDLRTPITAANLAAEILRREAVQPQLVKELATRIFHNLNRLGSMIADLLDGSKLRAGEELSKQTSPCDLDRILRDVVQEMADVHGERFIVKSNGEVEGHWGCDRLRRAFENLIGNAVKYGAPETPISLSMMSTRSKVEIVVHNEGNPIANDEIPLLFKDFARSNSALEGAEPGWGLGLTLVKGVVADHRGTVRVESAAKTGTSFILELPRV